MRRPKNQRNAFETRIPVCKTEPEKRLVTGWAAVCTDDQGRYIVDYQGDVLPIETLETAVHKAFAETGGAGRVGAMHNDYRKASVVESFLATPEKRQALGFGEGPSGWVVTLKVHCDDLWQQIKSGEMRELSIAGTARRVPIDAE